MLKNKVFTFLFSITLSFVLFIPTVICLVSNDNQEIVSILDFSGEEEEQKSEIENLELKLTFSENSSPYLIKGYSTRAHDSYSINYSSVDNELHSPPPEQV